MCASARMRVPGGGHTHVARDDARLRQRLQGALAGARDQQQRLLLLHQLAHHLASQPARAARHQHLPVHLPRRRSICGRVRGGSCACSPQRRACRRPSSSPPGRHRPQPALHATARRRVARGRARVASGR
eukprot:scaffold1654_cov340-Prasinococcus_capsulatus_cf.AAC.1